MSRVFTCRRRVEFSETDMAGVAHFSHYYRWMESAEAVLFDELGAPLIDTDGSGWTGWPRGRAGCEFHAPLRLHDLVVVELRVVAVKARSLQYAFRFYRDTEPEPVATGEMTVIYARREADGSIASAALPDDLRQRLEAVRCDGSTD